MTLNLEGSDVAAPPLRPGWRGRRRGLRSTGGSRTPSFWPPPPRPTCRPCTGRRISAACCGWAGSTGARSPRGTPAWAPWTLWHTTRTPSAGGSPLGPPRPGMGSLRRAGEVGEAGSGGLTHGTCGPRTSCSLPPSPPTAPGVVSSFKELKD